VRVSPFLESTAELIAAAFPAGIDDECYWPLLAFLDEHVAQENVADVVSALTGRDANLVHNDVLKAASMEIDVAAMAALTRRLAPHGLSRWLAER
jgi:hypothetical protein